ncbi:MAG: hypothetical protein NTZ46_03270 [Verrucomicrobia bacterium]|nr:hypothetical protein [Verrucomicrobiota bacterium]
MIAPLTINRKLQFFASRARWERGLRCFLAACTLLSFVPLAPATINIPTPPEKKKSENKKKDAPPPLPPQAIPVSVQVQNGGLVQVALRVYGRQEQATSYLVRKGPQFGKIVSLEPSEREVWVLTYQHTSPMNGQLMQQDRILFAAQNKNGTSSAAEIVLNILDNPPELVAPSPVDFGEVAAGIPATHSVTIANRGGGTLEGSVTVDAPWSIEPQAYQLTRGQQITLILTLVPDAEREYQGRLHFSSDPKMEPALHANALAPFAVEPAALELKGIPKAPARSAAFTLTNRTAAELTLRLEANQRLHLPAQIVLRPNATETLHPSLAAGDLEGMDGSIGISLGAVSRKISIRAASLVKRKAESLPALLAKPTPIPNPVAHAPLIFPAPMHAALTPATLPDVDPAGLHAAVANALGKKGDLPKIPDAKVVRTTLAGTAEFAWKRPPLPVSIGKLIYQVEIRRLSFDENGKLLQRWIPVPGVQITEVGDGITGLVTGIPLGISDTARIVACTGQDEACAVSFPLPFHVPAPVPVFTLRNGLLAGFTLLLGVALVLHLKSKR